MVFFGNTLRFDLKEKRLKLPNTLKIRFRKQTEELFYVFHINSSFFLKNSKNFTFLPAQIKPIMNNSMLNFDTKLMTGNFFSFFKVSRIIPDVIEGRKSIILSKLFSKSVIMVRVAPFNVPLLSCFEFLDVNLERT